MELIVAIGIGVFAGYTRDDGSFKNHGFLLNNELTDFNTTPTINPVTGSAGYNDVQPGDQIECFERIEVQRTL